MPTIRHKIIPTTINFKRESEWSLNYTFSGSGAPAFNSYNGDGAS